jgi:hypothetical protein
MKFGILGVSAIVLLYMIGQPHRLDLDNPCDRAAPREEAWYGGLMGWNKPPNKERSNSVGLRLSLVGFVVVAAGLLYRCFR